MNILKNFCGRTSILRLGLKTKYQLKIFKRNLNVHEHISYALLNEFCIPTPKFHVATTPEECEQFAKELNTDNLVIKAQVLTGGRGVGKFKNGFRGGVKIVGSPEEAKAVGSKMLKQILVTKQTGPEGLVCNKVMVAERKFGKREFYFCIMMERSFNGPVLIASAEGGVSIEDVAEDNPDAIIYEPIPIESGLSKEQALKVAKAVGLESAAEMTADMLLNMYDLFCKKDALLVEINPYSEDAMKQCTFFALDAKVGFDDNADFRQKEIFAMKDITQIDPLEVAAQKFDMNYISLDGDIGCMVNGAGLAMGTMDIIKLTGGAPANFLDVGGGGSAEQLKEALKLITLNKNVLTIFVNIFAGINRCDMIAEAVIAAVKEYKLDIPIVVRLQGTNADKGKAIIQGSDLNIISQNDLATAAATVVTLSKILSLAKSVDVKVTFSNLTKGDKTGEKGSDKDKDKEKDKKNPCKRN